MDFVIIMIFMTIMFLCSKAESDRKIGWTIVGVFFFLYLLGKIGPALLVILAVIVLIGLIWLFSSDGPVTKSESNYIDYKPTHSEKSKPIITKKDLVVNNVQTSNAVKSETILKENNKKNAVVIPVEPKTTSYHEVKISNAEKEIRYEEKKVSATKTAESTTKKSSKNERETDKETVEKMMFQESILQKALAIGEMEWTYIEKGSEAEDKIPQKEYFGSIKEAVDEYSIPDGYVRVMIERNDDRSLTECPALIWKDNFFLNVLPLIKKSPVNCWPLRIFKTVTYRIIDNANPDVNYNEIGKQEIANEFEDMFPEYMFDGKYGTYTTTFIFPDGLEVTNTSARELFKLLEPEFVVEDDVTSSEKYNLEIKELYKKHILWLNGVIDSKEYSDSKEQYISVRENSESNKADFELCLELEKELGVL